MFTMLVSIFIYLASLFVLAVLSVIIGFYVYKDSKKRRMNPLLWTVIGAVLNIPGLIAYLIARKIYFNKKCPACLADTPAKAKFCTSCGVELDEKYRLSEKQFSFNFSIKPIRVGSIDCFNELEKI